MSHDTACVFRMRHNKLFFPSLWTFLVSMAEEVKYILYLTIGFLNDRGLRFVSIKTIQVLLSRILSGLAIYLQNDLNFSENITLTVHKDMIIS